MYVNINLLLQKIKEQWNLTLKLNLGFTIKTC